jgi:hypothetical protein
VSSPQLDAVEAHQREQCVVSPLEIGLPVFESHCGQLAPENLHEEVAVPACRLQKARVNALGLALYEVKHGLNHPRGGENLPVVGDALFGFDVRIHYNASNQVLIFCAMSCRRCSRKSS